MAGEILVPRLGWNMEHGVFLGWLKRDGELVQVGEPLFTLEGDKAVQDIEALESGILHIIPHGPKEGDAVAVGTLLGRVGSNEPATADQMPGDKPSMGIPVEESVPKEPARLQKQEAIRSPATRRAVTPRARRAAQRLGVDATQIAGSGRNGRIREKDILAQSVVPGGVEAGAAATLLPGPRISPMRKAIAERMLQSQRATAPVTLTTTVDATNLVGLRSQFKAAGAKGSVVPSYTDFLIKLSALALARHPALNARWNEDSIEVSEKIHIGIAVDTEAGLLVPVIHDVGALSLRQIARQSHELQEKARLRQLAPAEMQGGTFTVTNLGAFGIDAFTPIINWPECAILGIGRIQRVPAVMEDRVVPRDRLTLSLTFDHRLVDGAPAARFLRTLSEGIENPAAWLVE